MWTFPAIVADAALIEDCNFAGCGHVVLSNVNVVISLPLNVFENVFRIKVPASMRTSFARLVMHIFADTFRFHSSARSVVCQRNGMSIYIVSTSSHHGLRRPMSLGAASILPVDVEDVEFRLPRNL